MKVWILVLALVIPGEQSLDAFETIYQGPEDCVNAGLVAESNGLVFLGCYRDYIPPE